MIPQGADGDIIHRSNPRHALMAFDSEKIVRFDLVPVQQIGAMAGKQNLDILRGLDKRIEQYAGRFPLYALALIALSFSEEWLWDRGIWRDHPHLFPGPELPLDEIAVLAVPLLALPQATHYALDAFLWRVDQNPGLAEALLVAGPSPAEPARAAA